MSLGQKGGLAWADMWQVVEASAVGSPIVKAKAGALSKRDFTATFTVEQMRKDVGLILDAGKSLNVPLGLTALTAQMLSSASACGYADEDYAAIIKVVEHAAHVNRANVEIDRASCTLRDGSTPDPSDPAKAFFHAWADAAAQLVEKAELDRQNGNMLSASEKYRRAAIMYITGERMPPHDYPPRIEAYNKLLACFSRYVSLGGVNCERVFVPYERSVLPALFVRAQGAGPAPCMVHFNGLDGLKEFLFLSGFPEALARRGVSTLVVDNPGGGEALRKHDLHNFAEAERPAGACVDYLEGRSDVDAARIGMVALSMGGHHAPRA
ncbi:hypothetical protein MTR_2040s0010, partial [Medicago truncatula]